MKYFHELEKYIAVALLVLMGIVVVSVALEVGFLLITLSAGHYLLNRYRQDEASA